MFIKQREETLERRIVTIFAPVGSIIEKRMTALIQTAGKNKGDVNC
ncbi:hypothetical protein [Sphingorhabdus sp. YGSMI21]|nr:hypothetical protein [Sphingorhabdus sp. YGSMI21]